MTDNGSKSNAIACFNFESNQVRVVNLDGTAWFVAQDLAKVLEYVKIDKMLQLVDEEDKQVINPQKFDVAKVAKFFGSNTFRLSLINESGLYTVIFSSTKPEAKAFKKWVTSEVLSQVSIHNSMNNFDFSSVVHDYSGFVYLISSQGKYKIGMSKNPYKRLSTLQVGSPFELTILERYYSFDCVALEKALHEYYAAYWIRGEWFDLPQEELANFLSVARVLDGQIEVQAIEMGESK